MIWAFLGSPREKPCGTGHWSGIARLVDSGRRLRYRDPVSGRFRAFHRGTGFERPAQAAVQWYRDPGLRRSGKGDFSQRGETPSPGAVCPGYIGVPPLGDSCESPFDRRALWNFCGQNPRIMLAWKYLEDLPVDSRVEPAVDWPDQRPRRCKRRGFVISGAARSQNGRRCPGCFRRALGGWGGATGQIEARNDPSGGVE